MSHTIENHISAHFSLDDHNIEGFDYHDNPKIKVKTFDNIQDTLPLGDVKTDITLIYPDLYRRRIKTEYLVDFHLHFGDKHENQEQDFGLHKNPYYFKYLNLHLHAHSPFCNDFDKSVTAEISSEKLDPLKAGTTVQEFTAVYITKAPIEVVDFTVRTHLHLCKPLILKIRS